MSGSALNIPSDREIRQLARNQKKNIEQQRKDREIRMERRNQFRTQITNEVTTEVSNRRRDTTDIRAPQLRPANLKNNKQHY